MVIAGSLFWSADYIVQNHIETKKDFDYRRSLTSLCLGLAIAPIFDWWLLTVSPFVAEFLLKKGGI